MKEPPDRLDFSKIKTYPLNRRLCKVKREDYAKPACEGKRFLEFLDSLPRQLKADELRILIEVWSETVTRGLPVIAMCGAHVLKVGLGPLLIQAMSEGWITALAFNGAGAVHDFELAYQGATSEDVQKGLEDGTFGMVEETGKHINDAAKLAYNRGTGFGQALAEIISRCGARYPEESVFYRAWQLKVPATVHVAMGTDIVHQHPSADGAAIGAATFQDFQIFARVVSGLQGGGLVLNFGSAVILPEVFLKALNICRNLYAGIEGFSTASFDMIPQYRPRVNVVERPTRGKGRGFQFIGHHEILLPILFQALAERIAGDQEKTTENS